MYTHWFSRHVFFQEILKYKRNNLQIILERCENVGTRSLCRWPKRSCHGVLTVSSRSQLGQGHPEERKEQPGFTFSRYKLNLHLGRIWYLADDYRITHRQGENSICDSKYHFILWTIHLLSERSQILKMLGGLKHYWGAGSKLPIQKRSHTIPAVPSTFILCKTLSHLHHFYSDLQLI